MVTFLMTPVISSLELKNFFAAVLFFGLEMLCFLAIMQVRVSVTLFLNRVLLLKNIKIKVYRTINFAYCFVWI